ICWPKRFDSWSAYRRAKMSMAVPGVIGATMVTSRLGNCSWGWADWGWADWGWAGWGWAGWVRAGPHKQAAASAVTASLEKIMATSSLRPYRPPPFLV